MASELNPRSKTIDNLGIDPSIRYAQDQVYLDKRMTEDTYYVSSKAQVDVTLPAFSSELEMLFQTSLRNKGWALFLSPPGFKEQRKRLFTFQTLPSLGSEETIQVYMHKLQERVNREKERRQKRQGKSPKDFEHDILDEEAEKESKKLLQLFEIISTLDRILIEINARRNQYQKG